MRELLGGMEENGILLLGVTDCPPVQINDFLQKGNRKKLSKLADLLLSENRRLSKRTFVEIF